jgi:hypothetical protein
MKYRKKPVVIEAFKFSIDIMPDWFYDYVNIGTIGKYENGKCIIKTLEGNMTVNEGDYIIKGINGEVYPCKSDIFLKIYEKVD